MADSAPATPTISRPTLSDLVIHRFLMTSERFLLGTTAEACIAQKWQHDAYRSLRTESDTFSSVAVFALAANAFHGFDAPPASPGIRFGIHELGQRTPSQGAAFK